MTFSNNVKKEHTKSMTLNFYNIFRTFSIFYAGFTVVLMGMKYFMYQLAVHSMKKSSDGKIE